MDTAFRAFLCTHGVLCHYAGATAHHGSPPSSQKGQGVRGYSQELGGRVASSWQCFFWQEPLYHQEDSRPLLRFLLCPCEPLKIRGSGFVKRGFFSSPWAFLALQRFQFQRLHVTPVETRQRAGAAFAFCLTASSNLSPSACGSNYRGPLQCYEDRPTPSF